MKEDKKTLLWIIVFILGILIIGFTYSTLKEYYQEKSDYQEVEKQDTGKSQGQKEKNAPDFRVYDQDGEIVTLSQFKGKPVIINFWATWCAYCKEEMPYFNEMYEKYKEQVVFLMIDVVDEYSETKENALKYVQENQYQFPIYFDNDYEAIYAYNVTGFPFSVFIDKDGNLVNQNYGLITKVKLEQNIIKLIN